jgi:hypothetical protein
MWKRYWDETLPLFLLTYRASTHITTGIMPFSMVFSRVGLPCDLLFGVPKEKEQPMTNYMMDLTERLHDTSICPPTG